MHARLRLSLYNVEFTSGRINWHHYVSSLQFLIPVIYKLSPPHFPCARDRGSLRSRADTNLDTGGSPFCPTLPSGATVCRRPQRLSVRSVKRREGKVGALGSVPERLGAYVKSFNDKYRGFAKWEIF